MPNINDLLRPHNAPVTAEVVDNGSSSALDHQGVALLTSPHRNDRLLVDPIAKGNRIPGPGYLQGLRNGHGRPIGGDIVVSSVRGGEQCQNVANGDSGDDYHVCLIFGGARSFSDGDVVGEVRE